MDNGTPHPSTKNLLGCQIWLEPSDDAARVDLLFRRAAESGLARRACF